MFWGMVIGTPISVFLVPVFFVAVFNLFGKKSKQDSNANPPAATSAAQGGSQHE